MCGVNGIMAYGPAAPPPREPELIATRDHMRARGPDGAGAWGSGDGLVRLGHRRLSIIDLSDRALQPMLSADGRLAIVFNGEIYNYPALRDELKAAGVAFRTTSDTEVLLHLFDREGIDMVRRLRGMFAFAIYDSTERRLHLARDPYGIKPLFFADDGQTLRFASQVKALLAGGAISRAVDPAGLAGFCLLGSVPEPFTFYRAIKMLPAGCTLSVDGTGAGAPRAFANIASALLHRATAAPDLAIPALQRGMRDSVAAHLVADVEVGVFLSAGVDSGALLGLMRDCGQERIRAITLGFDEFSGTRNDEVPLAATIARQYGAQHIVRRVARAEFEADLQPILDAMDQPSIDGVNTWFVAKAAREAGLKVALSGLGGDELIAGYPSFDDVPRLAMLTALPHKVPGLGRALRLAGGKLFPAFARRNPKALSVVEYGGDYPGSYFLRRGLFLPHELPALLGEARAREGLERLDLHAVIGHAMTPDPVDRLARVCALESGMYMRNQLLRDADWAGMAHSLEIRTPFVDHELLQAVAPHLAEFSGGRGKSALAAAPSNSIPDEIVQRGKTGFSVPTGTWLNLWSGRPRNDRLTSRSWSLQVLRAHGADIEGDVDAIRERQPTRKRQSSFAVTGPEPGGPARVVESGRVLVGATLLESGQGGIACVARMTVRAIVESGATVDLVTLLDAEPVEIAGVRARTAHKSKLLYGLMTHRYGQRAALAVYDSIGMARAHSRLPGIPLPYASWIHGIEVWGELSPSRQRALLQSKLVLVNSSYTLERFQARHGPLRNARVCWLATEADDAPAAGASFEGPPCVLMVGRMDADQDFKGHREMIAAWPRVVAAVPDARLVIVGGGSGVAGFRTVADRSPAAAQIVFRGFVPDNEMPALWRSAHVFALPSRKEGFGIVYVEAMRFGLPVIASIHDAGREVNIDGVTGFNVDLDLQDDLADKIIQLLKSPAEARAMGQAGRQRWHEHFRYSLFASRLREILGLPELPQPAGAARPTTTRCQSTREAAEMLARR